jgi:hypothetical protein
MTIDDLRRDNGPAGRLSLFPGVGLCLHLIERFTDYWRLSSGRLFWRYTHRGIGEALKLLTDRSIYEGANHMTKENPDSQKPIEDQPPPKQYAGQSPRPSGERGTDERKPKVPNQIERSEGDDENSTAAEQNADYSHSSMPRNDDLETGSDKGGRSSDPKERSKQAGQAGHKGGTGPGERGSSGGSGGSSSHSDKNR